MDKKLVARYYQKFGIVTVVSVYLLIMVGGIVRTTGSGMGCPDWPKCFGQWVPPTDASELPANYKQVFKVQGKEIADFNAVHTWIEYINRLVGALIGLFIFITFLLSLSFIKSDRQITLLSFLSLLAVGFQGWLGAQVVSSNLAPYMITLHMLMALLIVGVLIYTVTRSYRQSLSGKVVKQKRKLNLLLIAGIVLSLVQIVLGTQVREAVDTIARAFNYTQRELWVGEMGVAFYVHRSFSLVVLGVHAWFAWVLYKQGAAATLFTKGAVILAGLLAAEIFSGAMMAWFAIPRFLQPLHLLLGTLVFGVQIIMLIAINNDIIFKKPAKKQAELVN